MSERRSCEFLLVRYVPDAVRNEFVNIGVMLREAGRPERTEVRFTRDWKRVRCLDPDADITMLEALESEFRKRLAESESNAQLMKTLEESFSNTLQVTDARGCLAESLAAELEQLMKLYVEPRRQERVQRKTGRAAVHAVMRQQFERAGVWDLMRKRIPAATYTGAGDPLRIDCGYRPNGVIRMFHAVSLESDVELAKVLAFSMPALREGVSRLDGASLQLTAVVEPQPGTQADEEKQQEYEFAIRTMEKESILVVNSMEMERVAEAARRELRV